MNKRLVVLIIICVCGGYFFFPFYSGSFSTLFFEEKEQKNEADKISSTRSPKSVDLSLKDSATEPLEEQIRKESLRISQLDSDPEKTEARLQRIAHSIPRENFKWLSQVALDVTKNGDYRFLSVFLLAKARGSGSWLLDVAKNPIQDLPEYKNRMYESELMIRMKALEGIAKQPKVEAHKLFQSFILKQSNTFLVTYAQYLKHNL